MPITPAHLAKLPVNDAELFAQARAAGRCPIQVLDWYRLPQLFRLGQGLFGNSMMNYKSRTRRTVDKYILHACRVWREKYPCGEACGPERQDTCCALLERAFKEARVEGIPAQPLIITKLRQLVNSEWADTALKETTARTTVDWSSLFKSTEERSHHA